MKHLTWFFEINSSNIRLNLYWGVKLVKSLINNHNQVYCLCQKGVNSSGLVSEENHDLY